MKKCFSDPAVFKQLETDCYNAGCKGQVIDCSEFPAAEYRYFARLCGVYAMFKSKAISLEQAAAEKQRLLSQYNEDIKQRFLYVDACRKHQEAIKATESLCTAIDGGAMRFGKTNIEFWTGYFGSPVGEDYDG